MNMRSASKSMANNDAHKNYITNELIDEIIDHPVKFYEVKSSLQPSLVKTSLSELLKLIDTNELIANAWYLQNPLFVGLCEEDWKIIKSMTIKSYDNLFVVSGECLSRFSKNIESDWTIVAAFNATFAESNQISDLYRLINSSSFVFKCIDSCLWKIKTTGSAKPKFSTESNLEAREISYKEFSKP